MPSISLAKTPRTPKGISLIPAIKIEILNQRIMNSQFLVQHSVVPISGSEITSNPILCPIASSRRLEQRARRKEEVELSDEVPMLRCYGIKPSMQVADQLDREGALRVEILDERLSRGRGQLDHLEVLQVTTTLGRLREMEEKLALFNVRRKCVLLDHVVQFAR